MGSTQSKYSIELWSAAGEFLADLSGRAKDRYICQSRNEPEEIRWKLDLDEFENYCRVLNIEPRNLLISGSTEVRVKRQDTYLVGGQLLYFCPIISPTERVVELRASGFLSLFKDRYTEVLRTFDATQATTIGATLINETQFGTNLITNPSFEMDTAGWNNVGAAAIERTTDEAQSGVASLKVTMPSIGTAAHFPFIVVSAGTTYQAGAFIKIPVGEKIFIQIFFVDFGNSGTYREFTGTGDWQFVSTNAKSAPEGAVEANVEIGCAGGAFVMYLDSVVMQATNTMTSATYAGLSRRDFGVTIGTLATVGVHDRTYRRTNVKDALQALTRVQTNPFDFEFTYDKVFNTYIQLGSNRPDVVFEYPNNIKDFKAPNDGTNIANRIIALGAGFGEEAQTQAAVENEGSQVTYKVRERIITPNSVVEEETLEDHANAELAAWAYPFEVPPFRVDGSLSPHVTDYGIGDRVRVKVGVYNLLSHIDSLYRLEKREIYIDDNDNEEVILYVSV